MLGLGVQPKNMTSQEQKKGIEQSLKKFKELRRNLGPDASVEQKRYLDEMILMGEKSAGRCGSARPKDPPTRIAVFIKLAADSVASASDCCGIDRDIWCICFFGLGVTSVLPSQPPPQCIRPSPAANRPHG